ncbi:MAG: CPBP family intramembrane glutamic endopeptidase [Burkholderiales bacterium]
MSAPFWLVSTYLGGSGLPDNIPLTDIGATLSPAIAACLLIYVENGKAGLMQFLGRVSDYGRIKRKRWLIIGIFLLPTLYIITYAVMRLADYPVAPYLNLSPALMSALAMFFIAATLEEIGYSAYATDALQKRFSALTTSCLIGVPWALWHLPSMIKMGQTWQLIVWGLLATVAFRVITVWLYNNTNYSLLAVMLAHAVGTAARSAFPGGRHGYELADGAMSYAIIIFTAVLVTIFWGKNTLSDFLGQQSHGGHADA